MSIKLSEKAEKEILDIMKENNISPENHYLRIGVRGGGCSGFNYILDITESKKDQDEIFEHNGIKIICDEKSLLYLEGTEIDFKDELMGRGFVFNNPNATNVCGCGSSFS